MGVGTRPSPVLYTPPAHVWGIVCNEKLIIEKILLAAFIFDYKIIIIKDIDEI